MLIGYARTSTIEQVAGFEAQKRDLKSQGVEKIFSEQLSSVDAHRVQLEAAIEFAREGDTLVVTKLDRLARSVAGFVEIQKRLEAKGVALKVLDLGIDTSNAAGRLAFNLIVSIAQFEREVMLERQKEGIAKAKADGKYKGRAPTAKNQSEGVLKLRAEGVKPNDVAAQLGISRASVFRILKEAAAEAAQKPTEATQAGPVVETPKAVKPVHKTRRAVSAASQIGARV